MAGGAVADRGGQRPDAAVRRRGRRRRRAGWQQGLPALLAASRTLAPIPFIDTAVSGWVLAQLGIAMPDGPMALAAHVADAEVERPVARSSAEGWRLDGTVDVPWGRHVRHVVVRAIDRQPFGRAVWLLVPTAACRVETSANLAGEPRDRLRFDDTLAAAAVAVENPADEAMLGPSPDRRNRRRWVR